MNKITSWGRNKFIKPNFIEPETKDKLKNLIKKKKKLYCFWKWKILWRRLFK